MLCALAAPSPWAVTVGVTEDTRALPRWETANGKNGILPLWEVQDQDRSAEGAPNLESGGEVLAGLPNTSAKL